jgi:hypothetical protein
MKLDRQTRVSLLHKRLVADSGRFGVFCTVLYPHGHWCIKGQTGVSRAKLVYQGPNWCIKGQTGVSGPKLVWCECGFEHCAKDRWTTPKLSLAVSVQLPHGCTKRADGLWNWVPLVWRAHHAVYHRMIRFAWPSRSTNMLKVALELKFDFSIFEAGCHYSSRNPNSRALGSIPAQLAVLTRALGHFHVHSAA